jgi:hypothetical protein
VEPAGWLDLHALVPGSEIRDRSDHLTEAGCERVAAALAGRIAGRTDLPVASAPGPSVQ